MEVLGAGPAAMSMVPLAAASLGNSALNIYENRRSAREQMQFQSVMSSTAHQREVKDLLDAGLNPILSARYGGSSSPSGAGYSTNTDPVGSAMALKRMRAEIKNMEATHDVLTEQAKQVNATTAKTESEKKLTDQSITLRGVDEIIKDEIGRAVNSARDAINEFRNSPTIKEFEMYRKYGPSMKEKKH